MKIDQSGRIVQFAEKPKGPDLEAMVMKMLILTTFCIFLYSSELNHSRSLIFFCIRLIFTLQQVDTTVLGLSELDAMRYPYIASMGVYVFRTDVLLKLLRWSYPSSNDFGSEIIPAAVRDHNVQVR